ncbi:MAG: TFIIB-type zinc ribbon-containing protein [Clostridiales bacterium]|nr:TFIIB-type zinc ribbon-containing protein [Clostridiales bacterium]
MSTVYAICPYCNKNQTIRDDTVVEFSCEHCGRILDVRQLRGMNLIIDAETSNAYYADAKQYFDNTDFRTAGEYFQKSLKANPNNYLAAYYSGLCGVYADGDGGGNPFDVPQTLIRTLKAAVEKMENAQTPLTGKIAFLAMALGELHIMLAGHYDKLCERYGGHKTKKLFISGAIAFLSAVNELLALGRERLLVFDAAVSAPLVSIIDSAVGACFAAIRPSLEGISDISAPTDSEYNAVKSFYGNFVSYALSINPKYAAPGGADRYADNSRYNREILLLIDRYYADNYEMAKKYLSAPGDFLTGMREQCLTAVRLTYYTAVRTLGAVKNNGERITALNEGIVILLEYIKPRVYISRDRRVKLITQKFDGLQTAAAYLDVFFESLPDGAKKPSGDVLVQFYGECHAMLRLYYQIVSKNYSRFLNKIKAAKNAEYDYYAGFLSDTACACASALSAVVRFCDHKIKPRILLLKLCREICEEFLLLADYKIEEIESSEKYSDILKIYRELDGDLEYFAKLR